MSVIRPMLVYHSSLSTYKYLRLESELPSETVSSYMHKSFIASDLTGKRLLFVILRGPGRAPKGFRAAGWARSLCQNVFLLSRGTHALDMTVHTVASYIHAEVPNPDTGGRSGVSAVAVSGGRGENELIGMDKGAVQCGRGRQSSCGRATEARSTCGRTERWCA